MNNVTIDAAGRHFIEVERFEQALINPERTWICILDALDAGFPHLNWTQIEKPPRGFFDANLVRQMGFYILCIKFGVPKKRAQSAARMSQDAKWRAFNRIHIRMKSHCFRDHLNAISEDAKRRLKEDLKDE